MSRDKADKRIACGSAVLHCCGFNSRKVAITDRRGDLGNRETILTSNFDHHMTKFAPALVHESIVGLYCFFLSRSTLSTLYESWTYVPKISRFWAFVS